MRFHYGCKVSKKQPKAIPSLIDNLFLSEYVIGDYTTICKHVKHADNLDVARRKQGFTARRRPRFLYISSRPHCRSGFTTPIETFETPHLAWEVKNRY